jgi:hypothetical protein
MNNLSFGEKAYSAAKISAVLDALVAEGVSTVGAFGDADVSPDDLHLPSTRISRNQLIQCYRNAAALSRDPHLPYTTCMAMPCCAAPISDGPWSLLFDTTN